LKEGLTASGRDKLQRKRERERERCRERERERDREKQKRGERRGRTLAIHCPSLFIIGNIRSNFLIVELIVLGY